MAQVNNYCERNDFGYWAEPINALTNLAFIIAAVIMWPRVRGLGVARLLVVILFAIGIGSYLFHTHATGWAGLADTLPILLFVLVFLWAASRELPAIFGRNTGRRGLWAWLITPLFIPFAILTVPVFMQVDALGSTAAYMPVPLVLAIYIAVIPRRAPVFARNLTIGLVLMLASLTLRALDGPLCDHLPIGTHFGWHLLNGAMLGWMIESLRRHMLEARRAPL